MGGKIEERIASGVTTFVLGVLVCVLEYIRMDFLTSNFRLHSTDTILLVWGEGFLHPDFSFSFCLSPGKTEQMICESIRLPI